VVVVLAAGATGAATTALVVVLRAALTGLRFAVFLVAETRLVVAALTASGLVSVVVVISVVVVLGARCTVSRTTTTEGTGTGTVRFTVSRTTTTCGAGAGGVTTTGAFFASDSLLVALLAGPFIAVGVPFPVILTLVTVVPLAFSVTFFLISTLFFVVSTLCASAVWTIQAKPAVNKIILSFFIVFVMFLLFITKKLPQMLFGLI
jgi:hypothetical protein